jgi:hypothetical protein
MGTNFVSHFKRRMPIEGVSEQNAEENVWPRREKMYYGEVLILYPSPQIIKLWKRITLETTENSRFRIMHFVRSFHLSF